MHTPGWIFAGFAILTGLASPRATMAQPPGAPSPRTAAERAAVAEALFDQARRLMAAGKFAEACAKLRESERIDHGLGTLLNLADCYEQNGQTASAWSAFRSVAAAARAEGQAPRERIARERERALEPRLARVTIVIPSTDAAPGLTVKRDDVLLDKAPWGVAVPIDPGEHILEVSAPRKRTFTHTIKVPKGSSASITVIVPTLTALPAEPSSARASAQGLHGQQIAGIALGGVAVADLVVGAALGAHAISRKGDSAPHCHRDLCDASGVDIRRDARASGTASTVAFVVAGAALAGGATLYFTAPGRDHVTAAATVGLTPSGAGFAMGGAW